MPKLEMKGQVLDEQRSVREVFAARYLRGGKLVARVQVPFVEAGVRH
ncbi:MAG TPA: hypothetical protein PK156_15280 [Polyangium sp.]|nr:hypothetical protein [Polyangium sp.]